jgi:hypothetical protein
MKVTLEHEINRHSDNQWVGFAYLNAEQVETLARDYGPEGVVRFELITSNQLADDYYMSPDYDLPADEPVRVWCKYGPYRDTEQ